MTSHLPDLPEPIEPVRRSRAGWIVLALLLLVIGGATAAWWQDKSDGELSESGTMGAALADSSARPPAGVRIRVRVVNSTSTRGLARRATLLLREFGYDVVDFDTDARRKRETTLIQVHTGKSDIAERLQRVLGTGTVAVAPDSLRFLDLTVLLGRDWQPPSQPLRP